MPTHLGRIPVLLAAAVPCMAIPPAEAWDRLAPFGAKPAELLRLAGEVPVQQRHPVQVLIQESEFRLDEAGRKHSRYRQVFRIDHEGAVSGWGTLPVEWDPWLDEKPQIRARVITPDGREHVLDPATIGIGPAHPDQPNLLSERKCLQAPLPHLKVGAVAEVEIVQVEHRAFAQSGIRGTFDLWHQAPCQRLRVRLDLPAVAQVRVKGMDLSLDQEVVDGRRKVNVELGPLKPLPRSEPSGVPDQEPYAALGFTTCPDWRAAAREYSGIVDGQLKDAGLEALAHELVGSEKDPKVQLRLLLKALHERVRYMALEFGEAAIVPRTPKEVLQRGFGDCKDKATLLTGLLRALGHKAHVALLRVGRPRDVETDLPGLSGFDHAIVHLPWAEPLWVDPTVPEAGAGILPTADLERWALVASPETRSLLKTPGTAMEANVRREVRDVYLTDDGPGRVVEVTTGTGPTEVLMRQRVAEIPLPRLKEGLKSYVKDAYQCETMGELGLSGLLVAAGPFSMRLEVEKPGIVTWTPGQHTVAMNPWSVVSGLHDLLFPNEPIEVEEGAPVPAPSPDGLPPLRRTDLWFPQPSVRELVWRLHLPKGFAPQSLPPNRTVSLGPVRLVETSRLLPDGVVEVSCRSENPLGRWTPAQVQVARKELKAYEKEQIPLAVIRHEAMVQLQAGRAEEALRQCLASVAAEPGNPGPLVRLARVQVAAGLGAAARVSADRAVALAPDSHEAHLALAWVRSHDLVGRRLERGWDRKGALAALERCLVLEPGRREVRTELATLLAFDDEGDMLAPRKDHERAVALCNALLKEERTDHVLVLACQLQARLGHPTEGAVLARQAKSTSHRDGWLLACEILARGLEGGMTEGRVVFPEPVAFQTACERGADSLINLQEYELAAALLDKGITTGERVASVRKRADALRLLKPLAKVKLGPGDPLEPVRKLYMAFQAEQVLPSRMAECFTPTQVAASAHEASLRYLREMHRGHQLVGLNRLNTGDILFTEYDLRADGQPGMGWEIMANRAPKGAWSFIALAVPSAGGPRLVTRPSNVADLQASLGREVQAMLASGQSTRASWLLGETASLMDGLSAQGDPLPHPFPLLWRSRRLSAAQAADLLVAMGTGDAQAFRAARGVPAPALEGPVVQAGWLHAEALVSQRARAWSAMGSSVERLGKLVNGSATVDRFRLQVLQGQDLNGLLGKQAEGLLAAKGNSLAGLTLKRRALWGQGRKLEARAITTKGAAGEPVDHEAYAWHRMVEGTVDAEVLDHARRAVDGDAVGASLTLAAVLAELGRFEEARQALAQAVDQSGDLTLRGECQFVLGLLAERMGDREAALAAYAQVKPSTTDGHLGSESSLALARVRGEALRAAVATPSGTSVSGTSVSGTSAAARGRQGH